MSEIGLYIKDYAVKGHPVRKYGTDRHDSLIISKDGKTLSYYNLQNGDGSKYGDYRFCDADGLIPEEDEDLQIHGALAYANIGGFVTPTYGTCAELKAFSNELKGRMESRDKDNGGEPLNAVDRGYHLAFEHLCKEIDSLLVDFEKRGSENE